MTEACRMLARIDPAGARLDDYGRLLRAIGREFAGAHCHPADGLGVVYIGRHLADTPEIPDPVTRR